MPCTGGLLGQARASIIVHGCCDRQGVVSHLNCLAKTALTDAAQPQQLELVSSHQQVLSESHVQIGSVAVLYR